MADTFLHGVETVETVTDNGTVSTVKTAVIALFGTSPTGDVLSLNLCLSETDDDQFGSSANASGTIRQALYEIRKQYKGAIVFVVNLAATDVVTTEVLTSGIALLTACRHNWGFVPKIFIAPGYSDVVANADLLRAAAATYRGVDYLDCSSAMTYATALTSRGTGNQWNASSNREKLLFPRIYDSANVARPYSAIAAGLRAKIDNAFGFWYSCSNHTVEGVSAPVIPLGWELNDPDCQVNQLNALGITTIVNVYGEGYKEWGNRNAAYPAANGVLTFESQQRLDDITSESIELAVMKYLDRPMTKAAIDLVTRTVNDYFNSLISRGALQPGSKCTFEASKNSVAEMANGHYVWTKTFMGTVPAERITLDSVIDTTLLSNLLTT